MPCRAEIRTAKTLLRHDYGLRPLADGETVERIEAGTVVGRLACPDLATYRRLAAKLTHGAEFLCVPTDDTLAEEAAEREAAAQAAALQAEAARVDRAAAITALRTIDGIGPKTAARLVDHYHITSLHRLGYVLADPASRGRLIADDAVQISQRDCAHWKRQIDAGQVAADEPQPEGEPADDADTTADTDDAA